MMSKKYKGIFWKWSSSYDFVDFRRIPEDACISKKYKLSLRRCTKEEKKLRKAMDEETKRERFASWYSTLPGIPAHEKEIIERSLKYNVWKELIKLFVVYMILSLVWFFGAGQYDPFESVTGYSLIEKKSVASHCAWKIRIKVSM